MKFFVCTNCLRELQTFSHPCERCGSQKIEHIEFLKLRLGEHWRELLLVDRGKVH